MLEDIWGQVETVLGTNREEVNAFQMAVRAVLVYGVTLTIVRMGSKRFLGKASAFDVIVAIMLGSIMSRAITASSPIFPTLVAGAVLVGLHWLFAVLAVRTDWFGSVVKGTRTLLIKDGQVETEAMEKSGLTPEDLRQALREQVKHAEPDAVEVAYLERDGTISVIPRSSGPHVVDVSVNDGVKTVRIEVS